MELQLAGFTRTSSGRLGPSCSHSAPSSPSCSRGVRERGEPAAGEGGAAAPRARRARRAGRRSGTPGAAAVRRSARARRLGGCALGWRWPLASRGSSRLDPAAFPGLAARSLVDLRLLAFVGVADGGRSCFCSRCPRLRRVEARDASAVDRAVGPSLHVRAAIGRLLAAARSGSRRSPWSRPPCWRGPRRCSMCRADSITRRR